MITKRTLAVCVSFMLLSASVFAGTVGHLISLTEFSSTSLVATYDGSANGVTVTPGNADSWTITLPASAFILGFAGATWAEPDNPSTMGNTVSAIGNNTLSVTSDVPATLALANKVTVVTGTFDTRDSAAISITFNDVADAVAVPESGSTCGLLAFGVAILLTAPRLRHRRLP
jgi:hypothetical protein